MSSSVYFLSLFVGLAICPFTWRGEAILDGLLPCGLSRLALGFLGTQREIGLAADLELAAIITRLLARVNLSYSRLRKPAK
jgi:hypothetical protein